MADKSKIEWTEATWNPIRGCSVVSPGCKNCYAMKQAHRFSGPGGAYEGLTQLTSNGPVWTGKVAFVEEHLRDPLKWKEPRRIFVNSMSDLFHEGISYEQIYRIFMIMWAAHWHTFQVLTKRPERMKTAVSAWLNVDKMLMEKFAPDALPGGNGIPRQNEPLANVWFGVSCENQATADKRIPLLLQTPAAVRWLSMEPLLEQIDLRGKDSQGSCLDPYEKDPKIDWVVAGGESGPGARSCDIGWVRSIVDQCKAAKVPVFVKQLGRYPISRQKEKLPWAQLFHDRFGQNPSGEYAPHFKDGKGGDISEWPEDLKVREYPLMPNQCNCSGSWHAIGSQGCTMAAVHA